MSNDSGLFRTREELETAGWVLEGNIFRREGERYLPLYEAKLFHQYDHRFATFDGVQRHKTREITSQEKGDPSEVVMPRYWVMESEIESRALQSNNRAKLSGGGRDTQPNHRIGWFMALRGIGRPTDQRTITGSNIPQVGMGNSGVVVVFGWRHLGRSHLQSTQER